MSLQFLKKEYISKLTNNKFWLNLYISFVETKMSTDDYDYDEFDDDDDEKDYDYDDDDDDWY